MTLYDYITEQKDITHETIAAQAASLGVSIGTLKKVQAGEPVSPRVFRILATAIDEAPAALAARFPQATGSLHRRKETLTHVLDQNAAQITDRVVNAVRSLFLQLFPHVQPPTPRGEGVHAEEKDGPRVDK